MITDTFLKDDSALLSHKNKFTCSDLVRWMNLEPDVQNEVNQKEKNKYHILTHMSGI